MFDISLPAGVTGDVAQIGERYGERFGAKATDNMLKLAHSPATYVLLTILGGWVAYKGFVAVHQELYGTSPVKHDVAHRDARPS
jgi:hypothetical protein